ncbi:hypothetical protein LWI29_012137 [Acer saccharum]|uniref:RNase H type-1 domain-containing protein n=1 Tax=Acer saccharum TaxID=4024 RepID=A0AA39VST6_ACESA|nr:hypothetical protein LWI29_012137 [Acer saccharum]
MAWKSGFKRIVAETDSSTTVQLLCTDTNPNHHFFSLIQSCKEIINGDWRCVVQHVYREGNFLADGLAHMGHKMDMGIWFFDNPPAEIRSIFVADCRGTFCLR